MFYCPSGDQNLGRVLRIDDLFSPILLSTQDDDLKRQLDDLRDLSERQAQHIVTMETASNDQIAERDKELNEAKAKVSRCG